MSDLTGDLTERYHQVRSRIERACHAAGRSAASVRLIAVSKGQSLEKIRILAGLGLRSFGENYLNELTAKASALSDLDLHWVYIGSLQSHKLSAICRWSREIQTIASLKHATKIDAVIRRAEGRLPVSLQVNIDREDSKGGVHPDGFEALKDQIAASCPSLDIAGVMAIPKPLGEDDHARTAARENYILLRAMAALTSGNQLSLGMSADLEEAILCGSTCVRIGEALFGPRSRIVATADS